MVSSQSSGFVTKFAILGYGLTRGGESIHVLKKTSTSRPGKILPTEFTTRRKNLTIIVNWALPINPPNTRWGPRRPYASFFWYKIVSNFSPGIRRVKAPNLMCKIDTYTQISNIWTFPKRCHFEKISFLHAFHMWIIISNSYEKN